MTKCTILYMRNGAVVVATPKPCWELVDYVKHTFGPDRAKWRRHGTEYRAGPQWLVTGVTRDEFKDLVAIAKELLGADEVSVEEVEDGAG